MLLTQILCFYPKSFWRTVGDLRTTVLEDVYAYIGCQEEHCSSFPLKCFKKAVSAVVRGTQIPNFMIVAPVRTSKNLVLSITFSFYLKTGQFPKILKNGRISSTLTYSLIRWKRKQKMFGFVLLFWKMFLLLRFISNSVSNHTLLTLYETNLIEPSYTFWVNIFEQFNL